MVGGAPVKCDSLFAPLPAASREEVLQELLRGGAFRLERIVSTGHTTPEGQWYDQETDEWVALVAGAARLRFEENDELLEMRPGDCVLIAAHHRHRVEWTDPNRPTIWLALHYTGSRE